MEEGTTMEDVFLDSFSAEVILAKAASLATEPLILAWGLQKPLNNLHEKLSGVQDIVGNSAAQQRRDQAVWVETLNDVANDADDVLDEINYEVLRHKLEIQDRIKKKVINFFSLSNSLAFRLITTCKIKKINASLVDLKSRAIGLISKNLDSTPQGMNWIRRTNPFDGPKIVVGRDEELSHIVDTVFNSYIERENLSVMAIVGMAGLGKTTVAKAVYNDDRVIDKHFDKKIWVSVSDPFEVDLILRQISVECVNRRVDEIQSQEAVLRSLREQLTEKRCLLILDDFWNEDCEKWDHLMSCLSGLNCTRGSTIIVTTRSYKVAAITATLPPYTLGVLSEDECWSILKDVAFPDRSALIDPHLEQIGREITKKSAGVPLVAKVLGGMLRSKNNADEWLSILESTIWDMSGENRMMSVVKLSYDNLKSPLLKQCFAYCSMFENNFEIERDNLIQLWMAQGLLHPSPEDSDQEMEDIGNEYFNILLESSLFQDLTKDDFGSVAKCKMHDLVRDFVVHISMSGSFTWDSYMRADPRRLRHVARTSLVEIISKESARKLRSLFSNGEVPSAIAAKLPRFRALHVLNLYKAGIEELPKSIGKLKQLRYLNVSRTNIKALPKSIAKLHNLQTLRMEYCKSLKVFTKEVGDLVNLRHIYFGPVPEKRHVNFGWYSEPRVRVGQLTNIQTMSYFIVGHQMAHGIEELGGLNQLKGELTIYDLENVRDGDEAKKANLVGKNNIRKLTLVWGEQTRLSNTNEEDNVLEGLQPQPKLEILEIHNFMGAKFSLWKQLNNLKKIRLLQCDVCEEVTMLGHLPNLMHLEFDTMINLKRLGAEFYGNNAAVSVVDTRTTGETKALFPALKTLRICVAPNLTEWKEAPVMPTGEIMVFPRLEELDLVECPQLRNVPFHFPSLRQLEIIMCHELSSLPSLLEKCTSLENLEVRSCDSITSISVSELKSIRKLVISSTDLHSGRDFEVPSSQIETLRISGLAKLKSLPQQIRHFTSLKQLYIHQFDGLEFLPDWLCNLTSLTELHIERCENLMYLPEVEAMRGLKLERLYIYQSPRLQETCARESGSEWPKISHIPRIYIW